MSGRRRPHGIDFVINKTMVFGALAAFIAGVYVAIVVWIGAAIGQTGKPNLGLSILATALVAVAFQPVRARVQRIANRLVYGERTTPYEVLSQFSEQVAGMLATEDVLPRMARVLAGGTGAAQAGVWLRVGTELRLAAAWPQTGEASAVLPVSDGELPPVPHADRGVPVRHQGELLGALSVSKSRSEPLTPAEDELLSDLASQAGLVLRNVRLTAELRARLEQISVQARELKASRQRIVAAQDAERRRLERNIHDGAQQHLVALAVKLRLAQSVAPQNPGQARTVLVELQGQVAEALEALRDLARGIYPPILAEEGLAAALSAHVRKVGLPVEVAAEGIGRYTMEVEAAVYFCCLEALQNVAKYARASRADLQIREADGTLEFSVADDGVGFDAGEPAWGTGLRNMADRLEAVGGTLEVRSEPGAGTTVTGRIPIGIPEGTVQRGEEEGQEDAGAEPVAAAQASARRSGPKADLGM